MKNKLFSASMILFLLLSISACTKSDDPAVAGTDTFSISGKVTAGAGGPGIAGVTMTLVPDGENPATEVVSGAKTTKRFAATIVPATTTTTDSNGNYTFSGLGNGTYTVIPQSDSYWFNDVSTVTIINGANKPNTNFLGATGDTTYSISGTIWFLGIVAPSGDITGQAGGIVNPSTSTPAVTGLPGVTVELRLAPPGIADNLNNPCNNQ